MKSRRQFLRSLLASVPAGLYTQSVLAKLDLLPTPPEVEGPFYPVYAQKDKDFDLTRIEGKNGVAKGEAIYIDGQVVDTAGNPIEDAIVDLWQANAAGRYRHPRDPNRSAPLDPNFQGWAIVNSGKQGTFRFKTIFPGAYPAARNWIRPPHIHFKVSKDGFIPLTTQMYFEGHELNKSDLLQIQKSDKELELMMARKEEKDDEDDGKEDSYYYKIILQKDM